MLQSLFLFLLRLLPSLLFLLLLLLPSLLFLLLLLLPSLLSFQSLLLFLLLFSSSPFLMFQPLLLFLLLLFPSPLFSFLLYILIVRTRTVLFPDSGRGQNSRSLASSEPFPQTMTRALGTPNAPTPASTVAYPSLLLSPPQPQL